MNIQKYLDAGLSIIPVRMPDKRPTIDKWKPYQTRLPKPGELSYNGSIALVCGPVSGDVEVIDVDIKNDPTGKLIDNLMEAILKYTSAISDEDLLIQSTPSGGCHLIYKCEKIEGNQILANGADMKVLIETRGIGGYVCIDPTPGYNVKAGSFQAIPTITPEQRDDLFTACRSLNEHFEPVIIPKQYTQTQTGLTPWQDYNERGDVPALLQSHGWTYLRTIGENQHFCRPDKKGTTSGTWNGKTFYCFTSSTILEPSKAYSASALFTFLECNKDFSEAAKRLNSLDYGERAKPTHSNATEERTSDAMPSREQLRMTLKYIKKNKFPALTLRQNTLTNFGEIFAIVGQPGMGKTTIIDCIICAYLSGRQYFQFKFNRGNGKKVLIMDTERPPDDVSNSHHNIAKRLNIPKLDEQGEIDGLVHLVVSEFGKVEELKSILERELSTQEFDLVVLDGILDFSQSMNDDRDATEVVKWVRALAVKHNCAVVVTIHPNKGTDTIAGHLGSFLYRFCRAILFVRSVQGDKSIRELTGEPDMAKLSHADKNTLEPVYFKWDTDAYLMMECDHTPKETRGKDEKITEVMTSVLADNKRLRYSELVDALISKGTKKGTAKRWITDSTDCGLLINRDGIYQLNNIIHV